MDDAEWTAQFQLYADKVTDAMNVWVNPTITPLAGGKDDDIRLIGTGTHVLINDQPYILTCRHVAREGARDFGFHGSDSVYRRENTWVEAPGALDTALLPVTAALWRGQGSTKANPVEFSEFAEMFDPVAREIFYFKGFSRENAKFVWGTHVTNSLGYATQRNESFEVEDRFFYLHWDPSRMSTTSGTTESAAKTVRKDAADGYSGSLVWDTGFVRALQQKRNWDPSLARVCGQLVTWDQQNLQVTARRIEDVNAWVREQGSSKDGASGAEPSP